MSNNVVQKATGASPSGLTDSIIFDNGTNIGIGTTSPAWKVDVQDGSNAANVVRVLASNSGSVTTSRVVVGNDTNNVAGQLIMNSSGNSSFAGANSLNLYQSLNAPLGFFSNAIERMRIDGSGNIGIGTASPSWKVDIQDGSNAAIALRILASNSGSGTTSRVLVGNDTSNVAGQLIVNSSGNSSFAGANSLNLYQSLNAPLGFFSNATERMRIDGSGSVGIGTTSPGHALHVNVNVNSEEGLLVQNQSSGSGAAANIRLTNNGGVLANLSGFSSGVTADDSIKPNGVRLVTTGAGGLNLFTDASAGQLRYFFRSSHTNGTQAVAIGSQGVSISNNDADSGWDGSYNLYVDRRIGFQCPPNGPGGTSSMSFYAGNTNTADDTSVFFYLERSGTSVNDWTTLRLDAGPDAPHASGANVALKINCQNTGSGGFAKAIWIELHANDSNDFGILLNHFSSVTGWDALRIVDQQNGQTDLRVAHDGGMTLGEPTGGSQGRGTINVSSGIFKNGTSYNNPDYVFEHFFAGHIVRRADNPGAGTYGGLLPLGDLERFIHAQFQLPRVSGAKDIFDRCDAVLEKVEEAYLYILQLHRRLQCLEGHPVTPFGHQIVAEELT